MFTNSGTDNLQNSTFSHHEETKDHLTASQARIAKKQKETVLDVVHAIETRAAEPDLAKQAQINTMYYTAKEGQPLNQYNNLLKLQVNLKIYIFNIFIFT